jgi:hypothetical protein
MWNGEDPYFSRESSNYGGGEGWLSHRGTSAERFAGIKWVSCWEHRQIIPGKKV